MQLNKWVLMDLIDGTPLDINDVLNRLRPSHKPSQSIIDNDTFLTQQVCALPSYYC
jgi:hypothetical protein